jgi:hypothetical protein
MYAEATKSWTLAERAAANDADRARIRAARQAIQEQRVEAELEAARLAKEESEREVKRVIAESDARIHAAEVAVNRTNRANSGPDSGQTPIAYKEAYTHARVTGQLLAVECIGKSLRLTIQPVNVPPTRVLVAAMPINPEGRPAFTCGPTLPSRKIEVVHNSKVNAKLRTIGEVETYELR